MRKSHCLGVSLTLAALLTGCKPATPPATTQPTAIRSAKADGPKSADKTAAAAQWDLPDTDKPTITDARQGDDARALEQATRDYARAMEAILSKRGMKPGATTQTASGAIEPSQVHFGQTHEAKHSTDPANSNPGAASTAGVTLPGSAQGPEQLASLQPVNPIPAPTVTQTPPRPPEVAFNKDTPAVNTPLIVGQPRPLPATDDMAQRFARQVKDYPGDVSAHLDWQLLQLLQGQSVPQLQSLSTLPAEDREMLSVVLDGITNFRNALKADNNMLLSRKIRPMLELSDRLRTQAELSIPTVALCTDVKGFGVYEPLEPARFPADMKEHRVIVYCEVENFASQLDEQKRWETKLTQEVVLYTEQNGLEVWRDRVPARPIVDYSRNRRHDFFIVKMVRLPANLTIGRYLLKVSVTDQQVNRVAENTVPVQIVAQ